MKRGSYHEAKLNAIEEAARQERINEWRKIRAYLELIHCKNFLLF